MTDQVKQLDKIRMDDDFRMMFLFQRINYSIFVNKYNDELPEMLQFLDEIEQCAVQLDRMNKGAKISSVTGSSVAAVGGILSIVGLALIPVTAGVSMGLTIAGASLGATSAANSLVTTVVESRVNKKQTKQANTAFQRFMLGVQRIQDCLEEAAEIPYAEVTQSSEDVLYREVRNRMELCAVQSLSSSSDVASASCQTIEVVANAGKTTVQKGRAVGTVSRMASDVPDVGQAAVKGSLALSKSARAGLIALNALFLGMDIYFITTDGMALAKGTETTVSKFLRARAALWLSEIETWGKIHNSLCRSKLTAEKNREMLEKQFYHVSWKQFIFLRGREYFYCTTQFYFL
ncbi:apolipoprotein L4-like [Poecilia reticulata]|uniref:apolipoprotein L4-like n=1 Tax=Poecilia reticulata TaxID=8081 RepID=UPI0004A4B4DD|nr:PREDICTED: apolipoprotein L4-like [Poecilia reticulata]